MIDFKEYLNAEVINIDNVKGSVVLIDEHYVSIRYSDKTKKYNTEVTFRNNYLRFIDEKLNGVIKLFLREIDEQKQSEETAKKKHRDKVVKMTLHYRKLALKNERMKRIFGMDFIYPPYQDFVNKNRDLIVFSNNNF